MTLQYITRHGSFDSCHRVMNERMKCFHVHGHTYLYELTFAFDSMKDIGYAIDFKEIKRVGCQWIDDMLDHGSILNPHDKILIKAAEDLGSKIWLMSLNGLNAYCNPSVENIAKEIFLAQELLFSSYSSTGLIIYSIVLYETPNCFTTCTVDSISTLERLNFDYQNKKNILQYSANKGIIEYDDRKV